MAPELDTAVEVVPHPPAGRKPLHFRARGSRARLRESARLEHIEALYPCGGLPPARVARPGQTTNRWQGCRRRVGNDRPDTPLHYLDRACTFRTAHRVRRRSPIFGACRRRSRSGHALRRRTQPIPDQLQRVGLLRLETGGGRRCHGTTAGLDGRRHRHWTQHSHHAVVGGRSLRIALSPVAEAWAGIGSADLSSLQSGRHTRAIAADSANPATSPAEKHHCGGVHVACPQNWRRTLTPRLPTRWVQRGHPGPRRAFSS